MGDPGEALTIREAAELYRSPNPLAAHYARFRVAERILLTGHSHQAWPDCAERGLQRAFDDAAQYVDAKWEHAAERADRVRAGFARLLDTSPELLSLGANTHELVVRWLSALPLRERPCIVTTDAEFHSARRLLQRLEEEGVRVVRVAAHPAGSVGDRLAKAVDHQVAAVIVSTVFFDSAERAGGLSAVARSCERQGVALLLDAYHHLNVVPMSLSAEGLETAFVTGGGYKYCQLGEGNCFLRSPPGCVLRPVITGWFAEFDLLESTAGPSGSGVKYGPLSIRFAGATYDPTSHYRAVEVFDFFERMGLTPALLREVSQHQIALLRDGIDALGLPGDVLARADVPLDQLAGFLALRSSRAPEIQRGLAQRGVATDVRGEILRLGPAPYLSDDQLSEAVEILGEVVRGSIVR
jgi:kynureninase